jgi:hypothetical protein
MSSVDGVTRADLRCLVEDDDVEAHLRGEKLADRQWRHRKDRFDRLSDFCGLCEQACDRHVLALLLRLAGDDRRETKDRGGAAGVRGLDHAVACVLDRALIQVGELAHESVAVD